MGRQPVFCADRNDSSDAISSSFRSARRFKAPTVSASVRTASSALSPLTDGADAAGIGSVRRARGRRPYARTPTMPTKPIAMAINRSCSRLNLPRLPLWPSSICSSR
jgi:hypothetical protein